MDYTFIDNDQKLATMLNIIKDSTLLAIDSEFIRRNTYYPILCLLQISTANNNYIIDTLAITKLDSLFAKLYDGKTIWIVHSAYQDVEILYYLSKQMPTKLFDTQIAASFLNYNHQISYKNLVSQVLDVDLDKSQTNFNWQIRPLPKNTLEYAAADTIYLLKLYHILDRKLNNDNKNLYIYEETQNLITKIKNRNLDTNNWQKVSGINKLSQEYYLNLLYLTSWRESMAKTKNIPKKWLIDDKTIIWYAKSIENIPKEQYQKFMNYKNNHKDFTKLSINTAKTNLNLNKKQQELYKTLNKNITEIAIKHNITPDIICTKKNLVLFIKGENSNICQGWRYQILKDFCIKYNN